MGLKELYTLLDSGQTPQEEDLLVPKPPDEDSDAVTCSRSQAVASEATSSSDESEGELISHLLKGRRLASQKSENLVKKCSESNGQGVLSEEIISKKEDQHREKKEGSTIDSNELKVDGILPIQSQQGNGVDSSQGGESSGGDTEQTAEADNIQAERVQEVDLGQITLVPAEPESDLGSDFDSPEASDDDEVLCIPGGEDNVGNVDAADLFSSEPDNPQSQDIYELLPHQSLVDTANDPTKVVPAPINDKENGNGTDDNEVDVENTEIEETASLSSDSANADENDGGLRKLVKISEVKKPSEDPVIAEDTVKSLDITPGKIFCFKYKLE